MKAEPQPPYRADPEELYINDRLLDEVWSGRTLLRVIGRKLWRRLTGRAPRLEIAATHNGLVVFDSAGLHGGGLTFGQDFPRALLNLGIGRRARVMEFCAGPGYIGYALLANGFAEHLTLLEVNPDAVRAARHTASYNGLQDRVTVVESDGLRSVRAEEKWDLVVGNPPHFLPRDAGHSSLLLYDPEWRLHRDFYAQIPQHLAPGGSVVLVETWHGSKPETFQPMIEASGGRIVQVLPGTTVSGAPTDYYYLVSQW